jgi:RNA polymerase sigma-70 factor (ECF subfamily)
VSPPPESALAERLFSAYGDRLRAYLRGASGSPELTDDLAQDVFLRVVRGQQSYEARGRERAWLFQIAHNVAADHRRRRRARPVSTPLQEPSQPATQSLQLSLREALARLTADEREAFLLCEVAGLSYLEIAKTLGVTVPAVRSVLYRARLSLRALVLSPPSAAPSVSLRGDHDDD